MKSDIYLFLCVELLQFNEVIRSGGSHWEKWWQILGWNTDLFTYLPFDKINLPRFLLACREGQFSLCNISEILSQQCLLQGLQTKLPSITPFQACGPVYVGVDPRLANSRYQGRMEGGGGFWALPEMGDMSRMLYQSALHVFLLISDCNSNENCIAIF